MAVFGQTAFGLKPMKADPPETWRSGAAAVIKTLSAT